MTKEDKNLLLKDLCARLHYGVNANITLNKEDDCLNDYPIVGIVGDKIVFETDIVDCSTCIESIRPYLRPMSSMTEEERIYFQRDSWFDAERILPHSILLIDWLNEHHFDYRGLIEKGLALEAPKDMYSKLK